MAKKRPHLVSVGETLTRLFLQGLVLGPHKSRGGRFAHKWEREREREGEREREKGRKREGEGEGGRERYLLLAAGSYMAIEARSLSRADVAITVQQLGTGH